MKKTTRVLLTTVACVAFVAQGVQADDAKDDGPDMKETLKWIKKYVNEQAGGKTGAPDSAEELKIGYAFVDEEQKPASGKDAAVSWSEELYYRSEGKVYFSADADTQLYSLKLRELDPDKIKVTRGQPPFGAFYELYLPISGQRKLIKYQAIDRKTGKVDVDFLKEDCGIFFPKEESANKACRAFRRAVQLARGAQTNAEDVDQFSPDAKKPVIGKGADEPPATQPSDGKPSGRELQRRSIEKQITALEAQLPAARRDDADNRKYNRDKRAELQARVDELDKKGNELLGERKIVEAAAVTALQKTAEMLRDDPSNYKDDKQEDRLLKQIADLKQQLIDLRD